MKQLTKSAQLLLIDQKLHTQFDNISQEYTLEQAYEAMTHIKYFNPSSKLDDNVTALLNAF